MPDCDSHYQRTRIEAPPRAPLAGPIEADVCVVGAGIAGLSCALELLRRGRDVLLLEAREVAFGASGRNGGFVLGGYARELDSLEQHLGLPRARALFALSLEGVASVRDNLHRLQLTGCTPTPGQLTLSRVPELDALRRQRDWLARDYDYAVELVERDELDELVSSPRYHAALRDEHGFHFHPLNYCLGLAAEIERLGGRICEHSAVTRLDRKGSALRLRTAGGEVLARQVVLCGGGYAGPALGRVHRATLPIATYVMVTEPLGERAATAIRSDAALMDDRRAGNYFRLLPASPGEDGRRLLWGGHITARRQPPADLPAFMLRDLRASFAQLDGLRADSAWSGLMAYAGHKMPCIGPLGEGLWMCTAFGGHGMNTAPIGARLVAEGICGESDRYRLFEPFGLQWNGGPLGPLAAEATYLALRLRDWWREWR